MVSTELGACEWFVWDLRRSNLIDRGQLDQVVNDFLKRNPRAEPPGLAQYLVGQGVLTQFQTERLLQNKGQSLVLGPYRLMDTLGTGSMGTVYKALSKADNKWYAVKVLPRRSMWNVRIARRQVRAFEQIRHPAVVPFVDVGTAGGMHYLAWPLVEGETLETLVQREGKLAPGLAAHYALQVVEGLNECHQHDVVHGLLKPSNIMIGPDQQVHILDFGIGSLLAESEGESLVDTMSTANSLTSGLDCTSPESIMEPSNRTTAGDQYSLGCLVYYCLTGRYPFPDGSAVEKMMAHQTQKPTALRELVPEISEELEAVINRLMEKAPEARFGRAAEVILALKPFAVAPRPGVRAHSPNLPRRENGKAPPVSVPVAPPTVASLVPAAAPILPTPGTSLAGRLQSLRGQVAAANGASPAQKAPEPATQAAPVAVAPQQPATSYRTLDERLGKGGLILVALLIGAMTWLGTIYLKLIQ